MALSKSQILANLLDIDFFDLRFLRKVIEGLAVSAETVQTLTASGAVSTDTTLLQLDHTTVAIAATLDVSTYYGTLTVRTPTEPGVAADHTLTVSGGTLDGSNTVATFADINDTLVINFDGAGNGVIMSNIGSVVLS